MILLYIIVIDNLFLYIKKWRRPGVFVSLRALALVYFIFLSHCYAIAFMPSVTSEDPFHFVEGFNITKVS